jgi:hypothetical protein
MIESLSPVAWHTEELNLEQAFVDYTRGWHRRERSRTGGKSGAAG